MVRRRTKVAPAREAILFAAVAFGACSANNALTVDTPCSLGIGGPGCGLSLVQRGAAWTEPNALEQDVAHTAFHGPAFAPQDLLVKSNELLQLTESLYRVHPDLLAHRGQTPPVAQQIAYRQRFSQPQHLPQPLQLRQRPPDLKHEQGQQQWQGNLQSQQPQLPHKHVRLEQTFQQTQQDMHLLQGRHLNQQGLQEWPQRQPQGLGRPQHRTAQQSQFVMVPVPGVETSPATEENRKMILLAKYEPVAAVRPPKSPYEQSYSSPFPILEFSGRAQQRQGLQSEGDDPEIACWSLWFLASIVLLLFFSWIYTYQMQVDIPVEREASLIPAKGRPFWDYACAALCIALTWLVFNLTLANIAMMNQEVKENPETKEGSETILRFPITNPGLRAFQAGEGVALSIVMACVILVGWRRRHQVKITTALLAQFMLRGASLSLTIAMILEVSGQVLLSAAGLGGPDAANVGTMVMMVIVGFSEELAKLIAAACGTALSIEALARFDRERGCSSLCSACLRLLTEGPRALGLAGLAAGFGFMTVENAGYLISAATQPPVAYPDRLGPDQEIKPEEMDGGSINMVTAMTIAVRVFFNIHPWLTGLSALRAGRIALREGFDSGCLGPVAMLRAVAPSAAAHALYDFGLVVAPGVVGIILPPVFWYGSRLCFMRLWPKDEEEEEEQVALPEAAVLPQAQPRSGLTLPIEAVSSSSRRTQETTPVTNPSGAP